jgi:hypothetical protein
MCPEYGVPNTQEGHRIIQQTHWWGVLDVAIAAALALAGIAVATRAPTGWSGDEIGAACFALRTGSTLILILLTLFLVGVPRLKWEVLLVGLGWRVWLLVLGPPIGRCAVEAEQEQSGPAMNVRVFPRSGVW